MTHYLATWLTGGKLPTVGDITASEEIDSFFPALHTHIGNDKRMFEYVGETVAKAADSGGLRGLAAWKMGTLVAKVAKACGESDSVARGLGQTISLSVGHERWSVSQLEKQMEEDNWSQEERDSYGIKTCWMLLDAKVGEYRARRKLRKNLQGWKTSLSHVHRSFWGVLGVTDKEAEEITAWVVAQKGPLSKAVATVGAAGLTVVKAATLMAAGTAVAGAVAVSVGLLLERYYQEKDVDFRVSRDLNEEVDEVRVKVSEAVLNLESLTSDEVYDFTDGTLQIRVDPFFFQVRGQLNQLKDESSAQRAFSTTMLAPLLATANSNARCKILLPGSIDEQAANALQSSFPQYYYQVVSNDHSHPALWAVRRSMEMVVHSSTARDTSPGGVVMVGGSVRQVCKFLAVKANYFPELSGRDEYRRHFSGTVGERRLFESVLIQRKFEEGYLRSDKPATAISLFSAQDISKRDFSAAMVRLNIRQAYVALHIPVLFLDSRINFWRDPILGVEFTRKDGKIRMTNVEQAVDGYVNGEATTLSWVRPHDTVFGWNISSEVISQCGSAYLIKLQLGAGRQEETLSIWKAPDAGVYVLPSLTSHSEEYFCVPRKKFDSVVKHISQLSGAKNIFEAALGRIAGLESMIKLGGVVLEREWDLTFGDFLSVAAHAIVASSLNKSQALEGLSILRDVVMERTGKSIFETAASGYSKFFFGRKTVLGKREGGFQVYLPRLFDGQRTTNPYTVVSDFRVFQPGGRGKCKPTPWEQGEAQTANTGDDEGAQEKSSGLAEEEEQAKEDLNGEKEESKVDGTNETVEEPVYARYIPRFFKKETAGPSKASVAAEEAWSYSKIARLNGSDVGWQIKLEEADDELVTRAPFTPEGALVFGHVAGESKASRLFADSYPDRGSYLRALENGHEVIVPDSGLADMLRDAIRAQRKQLSEGDWKVSPCKYMPADREGINKIVGAFFDQLDEEDDGVVASFLLDGIAASAKSSALRTLIREYKAREVVVVVPSRKLKKDWDLMCRKAKLSVKVVTMHGFKEADALTASLVLVDEVYGLSVSEIGAYMRLMSRGYGKLGFLGDRYQQYEDGWETTPEFFAGMGVPTLRLMTSCAMALDSIKILKTITGNDKFGDVLQTRSSVRQSILLLDQDHESFSLVENAADTLTFSEWSGTPIGWDHLKEFQKGSSADRLSVSRVQGSREKYAILACGKAVRGEKWLGSQRKLFYVATSRHTVRQLVGCWITELVAAMPDLTFEARVTVQGRLQTVRSKEKFFGHARLSEVPKTFESPILDLLKERHGYQQDRMTETVAPMFTEVRRGLKLAFELDRSLTEENLKAEFRRLNSGTRPFVGTGAAALPVYRAAQGLWSVRRPKVTPYEELVTEFVGLDQFAVVQQSKDELLDQKNVVERAARPRHIPKDKARIEADGIALWKLVKRAFYKDDEDSECSMTVGPRPGEWARTRGKDFVSKFLMSAPFGTLGSTTVSYSFLKSQTKVKAARDFPLKENYGQSVLATQADFNAVMGPWSKTFLRNLRGRLRKGVIFDSGYTDEEVSIEFAELGLLRKLQEGNFQADVSRQDTSHTPVTLEVFCHALADGGVPDHVTELYRLHSAKFGYKSLISGLYRGEAEYNLGSGDPFTLIRNIFEVATVLVERYENDVLRRCCIIIKGDDVLSDMLREFFHYNTPIPEIRSTTLTINCLGRDPRPPYHAGRFFTTGGVVPDPIRSVMKLLVGVSDDKARAQELVTAFHDRYRSVRNDIYDELLFSSAAVYSGFDFSFIKSIFDTYITFEDQPYLHSVLLRGARVETLLQVDSEEDCAVFASSWFLDTDVECFADQTQSDLVRMLKRRGVPTFVVRGNGSDFLRTGVWVGAGHCWAVLPVGQFNLSNKKLSQHTENVRNIRQRHRVQHDHQGGYLANLQANSVDSRSGSSSELFH
jgi:hypothetical protein